MSVHAAFIVARVGVAAQLRYAATTRAADRGEAGRIGLPGGKVEPGESPAEAARREALEDGWRIEGDLVLVHLADVEGRLVQWFAPADPDARAWRIWDHAEAGRVEPITATRSQLLVSGYGIRAALAAYRRFRAEQMT